MTLDELIERCKKNDAKAQGELYNRYSKTLFAVCLRYSPNVPEAEDNLQDAFVTIFKKIHQFQGKGSFEGWLRRVTVNTVLQKYRKQRMFRLPDHTDIADEAVEEDQEEGVPLKYLLKMVQELSPQYRLVFSMYVLDGFTHKEISEKLDISEGTSKSNLARARGILKEKVADYLKK